MNPIPPNPKIFHITHVENLRGIAAAEALAADAERIAQGFGCELVGMSKVYWTDFSDPMVKEAKQAEFLVYRFFPWELVEAIGVMDAGMAVTTQAALTNAIHQPPISIQRTWYY